MNKPWDPFVFDSTLCLDTAVTRMRFDSKYLKIASGELAKNIQKEIETLRNYIEAAGTEKDWRITRPEIWKVVEPISKCVEKHKEKAVEESDEEDMDQTESKVKKEDEPIRAVMWGLYTHQDTEVLPDKADLNKNQKVHLRIQQRTGRKYITTVQGLDHESIDMKAVLQEMKRTFHVNGTIVSTDEHGRVIQLNGDQREATAKFLVSKQLATQNNIITHGWQR